MGKCVSKHPSAITIALSEQDLAAANKIWSKFAESNEYIALGGKYGNQLCEQHNVSNKAGDTTKYPQQEERQRQRLRQGQERKKQPQEQQQQRHQLKDHQKLKQQKQHHQQSQLQQQQQQQPVKLETSIKKDDDGEVGAGYGAVNDNDYDDDDNDDDDTKVGDVVGTDYEMQTTKTPTTMTMTPTPPSIVLLEAEINDVDDDKSGDNDGDNTTEKQDVKKKSEKKAKRDVRHDGRHIVGNIVNKKTSSNSNNYNDNTTNSSRNENIYSIITNNIITNNIITNNIITNNENKIDRGNENHDLPSYCLLLQGVHVRRQQQQLHEQKQQQLHEHPDQQLQQQQQQQQQQQGIIEDANNNETVSMKDLAENNNRHNNNNNNNGNYYNNAKLSEISVYCQMSEKSIFKNKHNKQLIISEAQNRPNEMVDYDGKIYRHQAPAQQPKHHHQSQQHQGEELHIDEQREEQQPSMHVKRVSFNFWTHIQGQSESKKLFKRNAGNTGGTLETKGTAMSFGFRKKLNTTPKKTKKQKDGDGGIKKQDQCNNLSVDSMETTDGGGGGGGGGDGVDYGVGGRRSAGDAGSMGKFLEQRNDNNGNTEHKANIHFEKVGAVVAAKTARSNNQGVAAHGEQPQQYRPGAENRFGFKGSSLVRPASTGITPRYQSGDELHANLENNNVDNVGGSQRNLPYKSNLKRRSKSAHSTRSMTSNQCIDADFEDGKHAAGAPKIAQPKTITFNLNHNTIEYQRRQFFEQTPPAPAASNSRVHYNLINAGLHTNVIVRPIPRPAPAPVTFTKFTLQTTSLPKPEYPVPIRVSTTHASAPPLTVAPAHPSSTKSTGARAKEVSVEHMDQKTAKQMANNTRRGFNGTREISADSGIASLDITLGGDSSTSSGGGGDGRARNSSPKRSRSRPRNLQMVMNGRHKFEVRDLDDPMSSESSLVEPLALPKLPAEHQTVPLPLSGLVRSNTVVSREAFMKSSSTAAETGRAGEATPNNRDEFDASQQSSSGVVRGQVMKQSSEDTDSIEEEKLHIDSSTSEKNAKKHHKFRDINTYSSKTSSAASSRASSWCNAGESLAIKDCSSLSFSSSEDSNKLEHKQQEKHAYFPDIPRDDDDLSAFLNTDIHLSSISSLTDSLPAVVLQNAFSIDHTPNTKATAQHKQQRPGIATPMEMSQERPPSLYDSSLTESKFAEIAAAGSEYLLDDETSPTDSLVSSTDSDDAACKRQKHKINEEIQEKDIDEISPELDLCSPISPGTPTHASHSLSLSDCGNLIDDEIADQPALLFNNESVADCGAEHSGASHKGHSDTPTLMETIAGSSMRSLLSQSKGRSALQQAIELSLRTPMSLRQAVLNHAESLDTLSPCDSICSDDLMMDFDVNSSIDSIDKSTSIKSRSGSDLNKLDESNLFGELDRKGSDVMKELNTILRVHTRNTDKESVITQLPARATRLLNRSRLQQQCQLSSADSESPKSTHSTQRRSAASRGSTSTSSLQHCGREVHSSSDDLMLYDKSFRNAMIQDVLQFKRQLLRLRRILQEDEDYLMRTETLNPFETDNGQLFASCGLDSKLLDEIDLASLTSSTSDDPLQELADLRRQVVYLQGQVDDRDRTIRQQRNLIEKLESQKGSAALVTTEGYKECINMATQTERTRPLSIGPDGLSRSKPEYTSYTTYFPVMRSSDSATIIQQQQHNPPAATTTNQTRRHTIISATFTNYNHLQQPPAALEAPRRASIGWERQEQGSAATATATTATATATTATATPTPTATRTTKLPTTTYKPVKITLIGEPMQQKAADVDYRNSNSSNKINSGSNSNSTNSSRINSSGGKINSGNNSNSNNTKSSCFSRLNGFNHVQRNNANNNNNNNSCQKNIAGSLDESKKLRRNGMSLEPNGYLHFADRPQINCQQEQEQQQHQQQQHHQQQQQQHRYQQLQHQLQQQHQQYFKYKQQHQPSQKLHCNNNNNNIPSPNPCNGQQPTVTIV